MTPNRLALLHPAVHLLESTETRGKADVELSARLLAARELKNQRPRDDDPLVRRLLLPCGVVEAADVNGVEDTRKIAQLHPKDPPAASLVLERTPNVRICIPFPAAITPGATPVVLVACVRVAQLQKILSTSSDVTSNTEDAVRVVRDQSMLDGRLGFSPGDRGAHHTFRRGKRVEEPVHVVTASCALAGSCCVR